MGRVFKRVVNLDWGDRFITCAWADCERPGFESNKIVMHEHLPGVRCDDPAQAKHATYVFCSERHRQMWGNSTGWRANRLAEQHGGQISGMLPTGSRGIMG